MISKSLRDYQSPDAGEHHFYVGYRVTDLQGDTLYTGGTNIYAASAEEATERVINAEKSLPHYSDVVVHIRMVEVVS